MLCPSSSSGGRDTLTSGSCGADKDSTTVRVCPSEAEISALKVHLEGSGARSQGSPSKVHEGQLEEMPKRSIEQSEYVGLNVARFLERRKEQRLIILLLEMSQYRTKVWTLLKKKD